MGVHGFHRLQGFIAEKQMFQIVPDVFHLVIQVALLQIANPPLRNPGRSTTGNNPAFFSQLAGLFAVGVLDDPLGIYSFSTVTDSPIRHTPRRLRR